MKFCAIDIEADQPSNQPIQIGAVAYDEKGNIYAKFNEYLYWPSGEPNWAFKLDRGITLGELLGEDFRAVWRVNSRPCDEVFIEFWEWVRKTQFGKKFVQWGIHDIEEIVKQSKILNINTIDNIREFNLKRGFEFLYNPCKTKRTKKAGLKAVVNDLGLEFKGRQHCALIDAIATKDVHLELLKPVKVYNKLLEVL